MRSSVGGTGSQLLTILMFLSHNTDLCTYFSYFSFFPPLSPHFLKNVILFYSGGTSSSSTIIHKSTAIWDCVMVTMERPTRWKCAWIPRRQKWRKHTGNVHCNSRSCYYWIFLFLKKIIFKYLSRIENGICILKWVDWTVYYKFSNSLFSCIIVNMTSCRWNVRYYF